MKVLVLMDMPLFPYRIYAYNGLAERGYDLTVVSLSNEDQQFDIPLRFQHIRLKKKQCGPFIRVEGISELELKDFDVIIVDPNLRVLDFYKLYRQRYWPKLIGWGHHKGRTTGNKLAEILRFWFFKKFKALVFYDYETPKEYIAHGFDKSKLFVANNTQYVDLSKVLLNNSRDCFIYVGRIQDRKLIDMAIEAYALFRERNPDCKVYFKVCGGGNVETLKLLVERLNIVDWVKFTGSVYGEDKLADIFNSAYAYVSPGHVGLGVLHSLAFGVPVITCNNRKHSLEFYNCKPDNSFVVDFNKESIADAMSRIYNDSELHKTMSYRAYNYYKEYCTIDKMVDGVDDAIKHLFK